MTPRKPNKVDQVRALFTEAEVVECVENTYIPKRGGTRVTLTKVGKSVADGFADGAPARIYLPTRVKDVLSVSEDKATYLLDQSLERLKGHSVTYRVVKGGQGG